MPLTLPHLARLFDVPEATVREWIKNEGLPADRLEDQVLLQRTLVFQWAASSRRRIAPGIFAHGHDVPPDLPSALERGGVHPLSLVTGVADLAVAISTLALRDADRPMIRAVVESDVEERFAVVTDDVAVPTVTAPMVVDGEPVVALFILDRPLLLGGLGARRIFVLLAPAVATHKRLLAELVHGLHDDAFAAAVHGGAHDAILASAARLVGPEVG